MKYACLIPARGGSKRLPDKNIKYIAGRPMLYWVLDAAVEAMNHIFVMTDDAKIKAAVEYYDNEKVHALDRKPENAKDESTSDAVCMEFAELVKFDHLVLLQVTSPLMKAQDIRDAIYKYEVTGCDSLFSVVRQKRKYWGELGIKNFDELLVQNGAIWITSRSNLNNTGKLVNGIVGYYEMSQKTYFEVDTESDFEIVEALLEYENRS